MGTDCFKCRYYRVTWDKHAPHGCRAFGFKGRKIPSQAVREAAPGTDCQLYRPKKIGVKLPVDTIRISRQ